MRQTQRVNENHLAYVALGVTATLALVQWWRSRVDEMSPAEELDVVEDIEDEEETSENVRYGCPQCEAPLDPDHTWSMESEGTQWVYITFHCTCRRADAHILARYPYHVS
ncbi:MAG: hypothetical protein WC822_05910, partial [Candidatus Paceibacterota bacterium]